jgi:hypothetical protein
MGYVIYLESTVQSNLSVKEHTIQLATPAMVPHNATACQWPLSEAPVAVKAWVSESLRRR